ncbi:MAG: hypothetical protein KIH69_018770 [Anaerolineae bacterium]|nr:hypothetical protein [Anaerolineae bacterium]
MMPTQRLNLRLWLGGILALVLVACSNVSVPTPAKGKQMAIGKYLLSFHACDPAKTANCNSPQSHQTYVAHSDDGERWQLLPNWQPYAGSVPDVIRRGNVLYIYTSNLKLARYRLDTGQLETNIAVTGWDGVDPSLFIDKQGRLVMFYLNGFVRNGDPAQCAPGLNTCEKYIDSIVEVAGSDGTKFEPVAGHRAVIKLGTGSQFTSGSDPDIFYDGKQFVLYISHGPSISVWTGAALDGIFSYQSILSNMTGGIPAGHFDSDSKQYWTYAHITKNNAAVIRRASHANLSTLTESSWVTVLRGFDIGLGDKANLESPGFALNLDSSTPSSSIRVFLPIAGG